MPTYQFCCRRCKKVYEDMTAFDEKGLYPGVECPQCGSKKKTKMVTTCDFNFTNPVGTDRWTSEDTGHDYRYKHQQPRVRQEREQAEKLSHMGSSAEIYKPNDDLNKANWDFSKI